MLTSALEKLDIPKHYRAHQPVSQHAGPRSQGAETVIIDEVHSNAVHLRQHTWPTQHPQASNPSETAVGKCLRVIPES
jgi:hypothetical protein